MKDLLILVGLVVLAPVWLPVWVVFLLHEEWALRRRPRCVCLTYDTCMKDFRPEK